MGRGPEPSKPIGKPMPLGNRLESISTNTAAAPRGARRSTLTARMPGITTKELMACIGHSSPRAALIYQHATSERDRSIAYFLDDAIASTDRSGLNDVSDLRLHAE